MSEPPLGFVASALDELLGRDVSNQETHALRRAFWAGDRSEASRYYALLLKSTSDGAGSGRPEIAHAKAFVAAPVAAATSP